MSPDRDPESDADVAGKSQVAVKEIIAKWMEGNRERRIETPLEELFNASSQFKIFPWDKAIYLLGISGKLKITPDGETKTITLFSTFRNGAYLTLEMADERDIHIRAKSFREKDWQDLMADTTNTQRSEAALEILTWINNVFERQQVLEQVQQRS